MEEFKIAVYGICVLLACIVLALVGIWSELACSKQDSKAEEFVECESCATKLCSDCLERRAKTYAG